MPDAFLPAKQNQGALGRISSFFLAPEMVGAGGLRLPSDAPLPGGAPLGSLSSIAVKCLGSKGVVCQN